MIRWLQNKFLGKEKETSEYTPPVLMPLTNLTKVYQAEIERLESHLESLLEETEALAQLKLVEWKIRKAEERKIWLQKGVHFPTTSFEEEQDRVFQAMEKRIREEEEEALQRIKQVELHEQKALASQQREQEREEELGRRNQQTRDLELQRIEAETAIALMIAQALNGDLV